MNTPEDEQLTKEEELEDRDWLESLDDVYNDEGSGRVITLIDRLQVRAKSLGIDLPIASNTPFQNTISRKEQPTFPGNRELERRTALEQQHVVVLVEAEEIGDQRHGFVVKRIVRL